MRRIIMCIFGFVLVCFSIPIIFTNRSETKQTTAPSENIIGENTEQEKMENNETYTYQKYGTVKLLHNNTGAVEELAIDEYLYRSCISRDASKF